MKLLLSDHYLYMGMVVVGVHVHIWYLDLDECVVKIPSDSKGKKGQYIGKDAQQ